MRIEDIEIHAGTPAFAYQAIRIIEATCEQTTAFASPPTIETVNAALRALAAQSGADAVINVTYDAGMSLTSWHGITGRGMAVKKAPTEWPCPVCAETIKRAALKCRFCQADLTAYVAQSLAAAPPQSPLAASRPTLPPLTSSNNAFGCWMVIVAVIVFVVWMRLP